MRPEEKTFGTPQSQLNDKVKKTDQPRAPKDFFKNVNLILSVLSLMFLGYIAYSLKTSTPMDLNLPQKKASPLNKEIEGDLLPAPAKVYNDYADIVEKRNIFKFAQGAQNQTVSTDSSLTDLSNVATDLTQNLKLVGIVLDKFPEAVIVDASTQETLFVKKGDDIRGAVVEDIQEGKVILHYQDRLIEIVQ